jgi:hypothetical protein
MQRFWYSESALPVSGDWVNVFYDPHAPGEDGWYFERVPCLIVETSDSAYHGEHVVEKDFMREVFFATKFFVNCSQIGPKTSSIRSLAEYQHHPDYLGTWPADDPILKDSDALRRIYARRCGFFDQDSIDHQVASFRVDLDAAGAADDAANNYDDDNNDD